MNNDPLSSQSRKLEDMFFLEEDRKLVEKARQIEQMKKTCEVFKEVSGIHDEHILHKLIELKIEPKTVSCLSLVPLVEVAWADGEVDEKEKKAVMDAATATGSGGKRSTVDYELLELWLCRRPGPRMLEAWGLYVRGLCKKLSAEEKVLLKDDIMGQARAVASASGGFLGLGSRISAQEERMLKSIESAFA